MMSGNNNLMTAQEVAQALDISVEAFKKTAHKVRRMLQVDGQYGYRLSDVLQVLTKAEESARYQAKPFSYQDYLKLPSDSGCRYQVLQGQLLREPSPHFRHQWILGQLYKRLDSYFSQTDPKGAVAIAPVDVTLGELNVVQPDILYVPSERLDIIKGSRIDGAPSLVVEIISPTSRHKDRIVKMEIYLASGVEHYWLVDPEKEMLDCYMLQECTYSLAAAGKGAESIQHPAFPGLTINLAQLWQLPGS